MDQEELRKEAAEKAVPKHDNPNSYAYTNEQVELACKGFFTAGAEWEAERGKWISVKDGLPNGPDIVYLVAVKNKNKENGIYLIDIAVFDSDGIWQKSTVWEDVTHWRELPALPTPPKTSKQ